MVSFRGIKIGSGHVNDTLVITRHSSDIHTVTVTSQTPMTMTRD